LNCLLKKKKALEASDQYQKYFYILIYKQVRKGKSLLSVHPSEATNAWINFITTNREFLKIRKRYSNEFIQTSNQGFEYFIQGNWDLAKKLFEKSNFLIGGQDLIIEEILRYMTKFNFITPQNWEGSRNLKE